jgi:D-arabinose 1-dehydrogenase-like Zn-dependent alcohol dehydrogenase
MSCFHLPGTIKFVDAAPLMCAGVLSHVEIDVGDNVQSAQKM